MGTINFAVSSSDSCPLSELVIAHEPGYLTLMQCNLAHQVLLCLLAAKMTQYYEASFLACAAMEVSIVDMDFESSSDDILLYRLLDALTIAHAGMYHINVEGRRRVNEANWPSLDLKSYLHTETAPLLDDGAMEINDGITSPI